MLSPQQAPHKSTSPCGELGNAGNSHTMSRGLLSERLRRVTLAVSERLGPA
jgi:hypothetical protein